MLEFRSAPTEPVLKLTWDEFEQMVRRGQVAPTDLVRANVITGDNWWTADNLALFHRTSAVKYPYGQYLAAEVEAKRVRRKRDWHQGITDMGYHGLRDSEQALRLLPLPLAVAEPGVLAASRFITSPSFRRSRIVTCVYVASELRVEVITPPLGASSSHLECPLTADAEWATCPTVHLPVVLVSRATASVEWARAPEPFRSPDALVAAARRAIPCWTHTLDGVGYQHLVMRGTELLYANWSNPRRREHVEQLALVAAYESLLASTGLADADA